MPTIRFQPMDVEIQVPVGTNLLDACHAAGIGVPATCGGKGLCGKCRVRILEGEVPAHTGHEQALSPAEVAEGWRLACLVSVQGDLLVNTADTRAVRNVILTTFCGREPSPDCDVRAVPLRLEAPSLADQRSDLERLADALEMPSLYASLPLLQELPRLLRRQEFSLTAILSDGELLGIEPYGEDTRVLGLAVDIGTTTIAGVLLDLHTGEALAIASRTNPQAIRGDDVVSRIGYASQTPDACAEMQRLVVEALSDIMQETCTAYGVSPETVYFIATAGNTTMAHLLLGVDPTAIAASPFIPAVREGLLVRAQHLGLRAGHGARLFSLPNISAYVGGDIVAGLLAHEIHDADDTCLLIDVGTNGEMALHTGGVTYACSTAAGPAFEGAGISCGMRAATGAISAVQVEDGELLITTVDDAPARGLCGTGLLDATAVMLELGVLDETGYLLEDDEVEDECPGLPPAIAARLVETDAGAAFVLSDAKDGHPRVMLTQKDVRQFQLAKGALAAGVDVLLGEVGKTPEDLDRVLLAGAFGNYLRPESALRVGLIPPQVDVEKISFVGNAALAGTRLCLVDGAMRNESGRIGREVRYLELSGLPAFQAAFTEAMEFPL